MGAAVHSCVDFDVHVIGGGGAPASFLHKFTPATLGPCIIMQTVYGYDYGFRGWCLLIVLAYILFFRCVGGGRGGGGQARALPRSGHGSYWVCTEPLPQPFPYSGSWELLRSGMSTSSNAEDAAECTAADCTVANCTASECTVITAECTTAAELINRDGGGGCNVMCTRLGELRPAGHCSSGCLNIESVCQMMCEWQMTK